MCVEEGIVIGMKFIFELFGCKTMCTCLYNKTAEKQRSFSSFVAWNIACKLMGCDLLVVLVEW